MNAGPLKVGVIGTGRMGQSHCRVYSLLRHAVLAGVCDRDEPTGKAVADRYGTRFYAAPEQMAKEVDAVSIATPTPTHFELAVRCLELGCHLFIEKPLTERLDQAQWLLAAAQASDRVVQVGHIERFNPAYTELKHVLEGMTVVAVNLRRLSPYVGSNTDVNVVLDLMIHDLDLVLDLAGGQSLMILEAQGLIAFSGALDHVVAILAIPSGPLFTLTASRLTEQKIRSIEVTALEGYAEGDLLNKQVSIHRSTVGEYLQRNQRSVSYRQESIVERIHVPAAEPLFLELQHFLDCICNHTPTAVPVAQGLHTLKLATQICEAVRPRWFTGTPHAASISGLRQQTLTVKSTR